ncbi:DUF4856 domain-containing protein [Capnocytophaga canimorsus]|uniref:DUF4856 domain-containing protein n=1 Tax=Capnocytophaga canimorsus TaxID=28188 RepID=UPI0037D7B194
MWKYTILIVSLLVLGCNKGEGETVESAYVEPLPPELKYSFSRNGSSSVDVLECELVKEPIDRIYNSYLKRAQISNQSNYDEVMGLFTNGMYHLKPKEEIATSPLHLAKKLVIEQDIITLIDVSSAIAGRGEANPSDHRNRPANYGRTGYIGQSIGDVNLSFADEKGLVVAEIFNNSLLGAIYLDKILNYHLDEQFFDNAELIAKHENVELLVGRNYTELEHHWDLAYGYFAFLRPLVQAEGIALLKDSERTIFNAFVQGRIELGRYRYEDMKKHLKIIRSELSRAIAIQIVDILVGENTLVNMDEGTGYAFPFISRAYGLIYTMQFARNAEGKPYFTYEEIQSYLQELKNDKGLWDKDKLLSDVNHKGSLKNIASEIGKPFGISINDIKR